MWFWNIFINPSNKANKADFLKSKIVTILLLVVILQVSFYNFYFGFYGDLLVVSNSIALAACIVALVLLRVLKDYKYCTYFFVFVCYFTTSTALWVTGGLHSVDIFWFIIISIGATLFTNRKAALAVNIGAVITISCYFYIENEGFRDLQAISLTHTLLERYINLITIFIFFSVLQFLHGNSDNLRTKQEEEHKEKATSLEAYNELVLKNVNELIVIHDKEGVVSYASPYIKRLLGIKTKDALGENIKSWIPTIRVSEERFYWTGTVKDKNNELIWVETETFYLTQQEQWMSIIRDVSAQMDEKEKLKKMRKEIAKDFHDEIGNKLASISMNASQLKSVQDPSLAPLARSISTNADNLFGSTRDFIWSLDNDNAQIERIFIYLIDFGNQLFENSSIQFEGDMQEHVNASYYLPPKFSRQVVLIVKEACTNVLKHSKASKLDFVISQDEEFFTFSIEDNGIGFNTAHVSEYSNGLKNMKSRAQKIGADLLIETEPQQGTRITLKV